MKIPESKNPIVKEFVQFTAKLKVLNSIHFKRNLKVPNKLNPYPQLETRLINDEHSVKRANSSE